jgi:CDP-diglyceride synthetase
MRRLFRSGAAQGRAPLRPAPSRGEPTEVSALVRLVPADEQTAAAAAAPARSSPRPSDADASSAGADAPQGDRESAASARSGRTVRFPRADAPASPLVRARTAGPHGTSATTPPRAAGGSPPDDPEEPASAPGAEWSSSATRAAADDDPRSEGAPAAGESDRRPSPGERVVAGDPIEPRDVAKGSPDDEPLPPDAEADASARTDEGRISVDGPPSASLLPHWTVPAGSADEGLATRGGDPTGEAATPADAPAGPTARWRGASDDFDDDATFADLALADDSSLGALAPRPRPVEDDIDEDYLTFEDLDVPDAAAPTAPRRGTVDDPIYRRRTGADGPGPTAAAADDDAADGLVAEDGGDGDIGDLTDADLRAGEGPAGAPSGRNRRQAIVVGVALATGSLAVFLAGALTPWHWLPLVLIVAAEAGAMTELYSATIRGGYRPASLVGIVAAVAMPIAAYLAGPSTAPAGESGMILVLFLSVAATMAWYLFGAGRGRPLPNIAVTLLGVVYVGVLGSYAALLLRAGPWPGSGTTIDQGVPLFILIAVGTAIYDAAGYLLGSRLGRTPLSAASPNKTREGLLMGMLGAVAAVVLIGGVFQVGVRTVEQAAILGTVVAFVAPLGDLFESLLKRDLGVKDMGSLLPSHGGLLDRVDALLFTLPAGYYTLRLLGLL